jgi:ribosome-associated protein
MIPPRVRVGSGGLIEVTSRHKALLSAKAAYDKKGADIRLLHVSALFGLADYFMICSGDSPRQVQALADAVDKMLAQAGCSPSSVEGTGHANWILMDYNDLIVHVFRKEAREFYGLDQLWGDAPRTRFSVAQLDRLTPVMRRTPSRLPAAKPRLRGPRG